MAGEAEASVRIVVDVHEEQSGIPATLARELGADVELASLPAGDYAVGSATLVERKRVRDLHSAVVKGGLWPQLGKLRVAAAFPYLLVEGTDIDRGPLHANAVRGVCLAPIDPGDRPPAQRSAARLRALDPPTRRPVSADGGSGRADALRRAAEGEGNEGSGEAVLAAVPGISSSSARALLARFGSLTAVVSARPDEWLAIPGIGPDRARALAETLGCRFDDEA